MSQITKDFCELMLHRAANQCHSPLTIWEEEQLARAWLDRNQRMTWIPVSEKPKPEHCGTTLLVLCKNPAYEKSPDWEQPFFVDCSHFDGDDFGICAEVVAYMLAPNAEPPIPHPQQPRATK